MVAPPHAPPTCPIASAQIDAVPPSTAVATHDKPLPHGIPDPHAWLRSPRSWQVIVDPTQDWPCPHSEAAHGSPGWGAGAQVPHTALRVPPQNPLEHWPLNAQG